MGNTANGQRRRINRAASGVRVVRIELKDRMGNPRWITADLLDISETGIGVSIMTPLQTGTTIVVRGDLGNGRTDPQFSVAVKWCVERANGMFRAGLSFSDERAESAKESPEETRPDFDELDCYEIMQLSPNADNETISRVYRFLAQRYHPDHAETGNPDLFVQLSEAYRILSDPEQRAKYDVRHLKTKRLRWKVFDQAQMSAGPESEKRKRHGILGLLYSKCLHDPDNAHMTVFEFEELLGCPREHLETALWYLRGKGLINRSDNGRHTITILGFDEVEKQVGSKTLRLEPGPTPSATSD